MKTKEFAKYANLYTLNFKDQKIRKEWEIDCMEFRISSVRIFYLFICFLGTMNVLLFFLFMGFGIISKDDQIPLFVYTNIGGVLALLSVIAFSYHY